MTTPYKTLQGARARAFMANWPNFAPSETTAAGKTTVKLYAYTEEERLGIDAKLRQIAHVKL